MLAQQHLDSAVALLEMLLDEGETWPPGSPLPNNLLGSAALDASHTTGHNKLNKAPIQVVCSHVVKSMNLGYRSTSLDLWAFVVVSKKEGTAVQTEHYIPADDSTLEVPTLRLQ